MKLSAQTHQTFEAFFRDFFAEEELKLPQTRFYLKSGSSLITKILRVDGLTIGKHIIIKPTLAKTITKSSFQINKKLLAHELTHVLQYQRMGFIGFLLSYFSDFFYGIKRKKQLNIQARMEAYWEISHEIEARNAADNFEKWIKER